MEAAVISATRVVAALGVGLAPLAGQVVEELTDAVYAQLVADLATVTGNGSVTLSADHGTITVNPPSADYTANQAAIAAQIALVAQHRATLSALYASQTANTAQIAADLTALSTIMNALDAGTQPTAAQQVIIDRVYGRLFIILFG